MKYEYIATWLQGNSNVSNWSAQFPLNSIISQSSKCTNVAFQLYQVTRQCYQMAVNISTSRPVSPVYTRQPPPCIYPHHPPPHQTDTLLFLHPSLKFRAGRGIPWDGPHSDTERWADENWTLGAGDRNLFYVPSSPLEGGSWQGANYTLSWLLKLFSPRHPLRLPVLPTIHTGVFKKEKGMVYLVHNLITIYIHVYIIVWSLRTFYTQLVHCMTSYSRGNDSFIA